MRRPAPTPASRTAAGDRWRQRDAERIGRAPASRRGCAASVGANSCTPVICRRLFGIAPATACTVTTLSTRCSGSGPLKFGTWPYSASPPVRISKKRCFCRRTRPGGRCRLPTPLRVEGAGAQRVERRRPRGAGMGWRPRTCIVSAISEGAKPPAVGDAVDLDARRRRWPGATPCVFTKTPAVSSWTKTRRQAGST